MRNDLKEQCDMIQGTRNGIEQFLLIGHGQPYVNKVMAKIDLIIKLTAEMGISLDEVGIGSEVKLNLLTENSINFQNLKKLVEENRNC